MIFHFTCLRKKKIQELLIKSAIKSFQLLSANYRAVERKKTRKIYQNADLEMKRNYFCGEKKKKIKILNETQTAEKL